MSAWGAPSTRVAHPPGGASNFTFDDGSGPQLGFGKQNPPRRSQFSGPIGVPPGGASNFVFDDHVSRGGVSDYDALSRRHTNGVLRKSVSEGPMGGARAPAQRNYNILADATGAEAAPQARTRHRGGAQQPAGGHSQFSVGWGGAQEGNHHMDYLRRPAALPAVGAPAGLFAPPPAERADLFARQPQQQASSYACNAPYMHQEPPQAAPQYLPPQAAPQYMNRSPGFQRQQHQPTNFQERFQAAPPPPRASTYVAQPPGGASSIMLG